MRQKNAMAELMLIELAEIEQKVSAALSGKRSLSTPAPVTGRCLRCDAG